MLAGMRIKRISRCWLLSDTRGPPGVYQGGRSFELYRDAQW